MKNINITVRDASAETSTVTVPAQDAAADDGLDTLIAGVSAGVVARRSVTSAIAVLDGSTPAEPYAQNELGLRIYWSDNVTGRTGYFTIPAPDLDALQLAGDEVDLTDAGVMAALVTWINANGASPIDGNAITVTSARIVGRK